MAAGGVEVDSRVACSICLEPYRGREAKLLPCFHTFCLPCLTKLASRQDTAQTPDTAGPDSEEKGGGSADSLTCPTCRRVIPLPSGGVAGFQKIFYLDHSSSSSGEDDPQCVPCTLCDGDLTAQFHCGQCQNNFCSQCRRSHDKLCQGGQARALQDPSDKSSSSSSSNSSNSSSSTAQMPSLCQVRHQQLQMVEEAVKKLGEEEKRLDQEREAMDHSINDRYANLLSHAADARDACKQSLREACDGMTERLHSSMAEARHAQDTLQRQLSPSQPAPVSTAQQRAALFLQGELQMILDRDLDTCSLLHHHTEVNPSLMTGTLHAFMGNIVKSSQVSIPARSKLPSESQHFEDDHDGVISSVGVDPKNLNDLYKKVEDLTGKVASQQSTNTQLFQHVTVLSNANSRLATDQSSLQRKVTTLKDNNATLTTQQAALQREVTAMRDKHAIVHQDLAALTAEKDNACAQLTLLQTDLASVQADVTSVQADVTSVQTDTSRQLMDILQLKADHGDVLAKLSGVQTDMAAFQGDHSRVTTDADQLKKDCSELRSDLTGIQGKLTILESRFTTANTQVGFHARLTEKVTIGQERTLICDGVKSNEGGGYNGQTGVFTAPVTGTYCFLATASPNEPDLVKKARLDIVVEDQRKGYVLATGHSWSTGHCVVKVRAGGEVFLRTYNDGEYTFGYGWTRFSGMLLQAEV